MKLFIALKKRCKLQKALRVKMVFNRVNFEWLVTVKLTSKFVFQLSSKKKNFMQGHRDQKQNPAELEQ